MPKTIRVEDVEQALGKDNAAKLLQAIQKRKAPRKARAIHITPKHAEEARNALGGSRAARDLASLGLALRGWINADPLAAAHFAAWIEIGLNDADVPATDGVPVETAQEETPDVEPEPVLTGSRSGNRLSRASGGSWPL